MTLITDKNDNLVPVDNPKELERLQKENARLMRSLKGEVRIGDVWKQRISTVEFLIVTLSKGDVGVTALNMTTGESKHFSWSSFHEFKREVRIGLPNEGMTFKEIQESKEN